MKVEIGDATLYCGNCLEVLRTLPESSVDAVVTDPPYGLSFMGKRWDYDVPAEEIWRECLRVLKPGGHLLAFAGTRTQHRMAVRIEDAGFEIRDLIAWVYGSGFPKSLDVSKAIDKAAGAEREVVGRSEYASRRPNPMNGTAYNYNAQQYDISANLNITAPATEAAKQWQGWGTALKPALEPITVARKPLEGTVAENVLAHGTGAMNVDGCRVGTNGESLNGGSTVGSHGAHEGWRRPWMDDPDHNAKAAERAKERVARAEVLGRWPANLIHDGSDEVVGMFPVTGVSSGGTKHATPKFKNQGGGNSWKSIPVDDDNGFGYGDTGSAARFFYCAKASKADRDEGCEGLEERKPAQEYGLGAVEGNPRKPSNCTAAKPVRNHHPTVKPTDLMRYLCRLVTPPGGIVLDPFAGSGSTGKAALLEGFRFVGIEREAEYVEIARARIAAAKPEQGDLFA